VTLKLDLEAPVEEVAKTRSAAPRPVPGRRGAARLGSSETSWWTARATAGEVKAGFTKEEILRKPEANPRAEGGMFSCLERLLRALSL
jgi:hypothetical protein